MQFSPFLYYCLKSVLGILELGVNLLFAYVSIDAFYIGLECDVIIKIQEKYHLWTTVDLSSKTGNHSCLD